jgi:hypothetical protein
MNTPALTVAQVPDSYIFTNDTREVAEYRAFFCDALEYDAFFVRIEGCAIVDGYGMHGVIPWNGKTVYPLQTRESRIARAMFNTFCPHGYRGNVATCVDCVRARDLAEDAAQTAARHEEILAGLVGRVAHSRFIEANTGRKIQWTYSANGSML